MASFGYFLLAGWALFFAGDLWNTIDLLNVGTTTTWKGIASTTICHDTKITGRWKGQQDGQRQFSWRWQEVRGRSVYSWSYIYCDGCFWGCWRHWICPQGSRETCKTFLSHSSQRHQRYVFTGELKKMPLYFWNLKSQNLTIHICMIQLTHNKRIFIWIISVFDLILCRIFKFILMHISVIVFSFINVQQFYVYFIIALIFKKHEIERSRIMFKTLLVLYYYNKFLTMINLKFY